MILASAAVVLVVVPGVAVVAAGAGGTSTDNDPMIADAMKTEHGIIAAYNDKRWDQLGPLYAPDATMVPPNHEPVQGRDAIVEYLRSVRDAAGPVTEPNTEPVRIRSSSNLANVIGRFSLQSGRLRLTANELFERQADGSVLCGVDEFSFRDAAG
jgi:ketosteroid isomerase-like protein